MDDIGNDNRKHLNRFKFEPPSSSYIAGLIDGDGCIFLRKIKYGYQSGFAISQCRTNVLQIIRYHFGGSITSSSNRNNKVVDVMDDDETYNKNNQRNQYNLNIRSNEYNLILEYLRNSFIIKHIEYECLYKFSRFVDIPNRNEEKEQIFNEYLNHKRDNIDNNFNAERLNIEYIAGLFDAEGCLYINKTNYNKFYISIVQKNSPILINEIIKYLGFGNVDENYRFKIYNKLDCLKFISLIKNKLIVKYNQSEAFERFLITNQIIEKEQMYKICNEEKHKIEIYEQLNKNNDGKEMFFEKLRLQNVKTLICREIKNKQNYREKSDNMKGMRNHNYGKQFSDKTKSKMSLSIKKSKRKISDEIIVEIQKLINQGYKNVEIQKIFDLPRHTITRIKNGTITCINEQI